MAGVLRPKAMGTGPQPAIGLVGVLLALGACGRCGDHAPAPVALAGPRDAAAPARADAVRELPPLALGLPSADAFAYRHRAGHPDYRDARAAERRGDWPAVAAACRKALAADPGHLEASYLLSVALAKAGQLDAVLAPLEVAAAGDYLKWGAASLAQPALQPFLATPTGQAWRRRVEADRAAFLAAVQRGVLVRAQGDIFAVDVAAPRWYRLTHAGAVVAGLAVLRSYRNHVLGFVARRRGIAAFGAVDLDTGREVRTIPLGAAPHVEIAYRVHEPTGWIVRTTGRPERLEADGTLLPTSPNADYPSYLAFGRALEVDGDHAELRDTHEAPDVSADWDDHELASAMRIGASNRVVTAPSGSLIDGGSLRSSPDRAALAYVAVADHCDPAAPPAAPTQVFVADTTTGAVHALEIAHDGLGIEWASDGSLAIAGDHGVSLATLSGGAPVPLPGATDLLVPRRPSPCPIVAAAPPAEDDVTDAVVEPPTPPDAGAPR